MTWALNHLSYFLLTALLDDSLQAADGARVVTVSSRAHRGKIAFDDVEARDDYHYWRAYRQSKLANLLFAYELSRRYEGTGITSNACRNSSGSSSAACFTSCRTSFGSSLSGALYSGSKTAARA